jgi:secondary thiamine-phosphate synthase enzyme
MDTLAPAHSCRHSRIRVETQRSTAFIDITDQVEATVAGTGVRDGLVNVQTLHTTTAIVVNEHEPLLITDFAALLERIAPEQNEYRHDDMTARTVNLAPGERPNGHAHCRALLLGSSAMLNLAAGRLQLGRWQRVFFVEMDGPRCREISVLVLGGGVR